MFSGTKVYNKTSKHKHGLNRAHSPVFKPGRHDNYIE